MFPNYIETDYDRYPNKQRNSKQSNAKTYWNFFERLFEDRTGCTFCVDCIIRIIVTTVLSQRTQLALLFLIDCTMPTELYFR